MTKSHHDERSEGLLGLARRTAEGLADLVGSHLKLARLEFVEDLLKVVTRARAIVVLGALVLVGYGLVMAGLAVFAGGSRAVGVSLLAVGGAHVGVCGLVLLLAVRRLGAMHLMDDTSGEMRESLALLGRRGTAVASGSLGRPA
jgi:hypothetical protein